MIGVPPLVGFFALLFAVLAAAFVTALVLARRGPGAVHWRDVAGRVGGWGGIVAVLAAAFAAGTAATILLFALLSFWCLREFLSLTPTRRGDHYAIAAAFYLFLPAQYWLVWDGWLGLFVLLIPVYAFLTLPVVAVLAGDPRDFLQRIAKMQWALMLAVFSLSHAPALLRLEVPGAAGGFGLLAFLLVVVQGSEVGQFVFGRRFGRRRIAPEVSAGRTWEGLALGGGAAVLAGLALHWLTPFGPWGALAMAAGLVATGTLGGLVLSAVKRSLGAGHGVPAERRGRVGMLDRIDSLAFAAPVFFHLTHYLFLT